MNFYKHHLGDYDGATAHLSWDEDMAYTRLLRVYYRRERPLIDAAEAYRLIRAVSKARRSAVDTVLSEFFEQRPDGWHNKRADEEISAYQAQASHNRIVGNLGGRPKKTTVVSENNQSGSEKKPINNPNQEPEPEPLTKDQKLSAHADPWKVGKEFLIANGVSKTSAGSVIGKWAKECGHPAVISALQAAIDAKPAEPVGFITAILQNRPKKFDAVASNLEFIRSQT